jgi:hypothetical protein
MCQKPADEYVRDHCHLTGKYRGPACQTCNKKAKAMRQIPVFFHNIAFDGNLILHGIATLAERDPEYSNVRLSVLAKSAEKPMQIVWGPLVFRDSVSFMSGALDKCITAVKDAAKYNRRSLASTFSYVRRYHPSKPTDATIPMLMRKAPFPYRALTGPECFNRPPLLPQEEYYDDLKEKPCSDKDYDWLKDVTRSMRDFGDFHDHYLAMDVLGLADCFENFRGLYKTITGLDIVHYVSLPSFAMSAMLRMTDAKLPLITEDTGGFDFLNVVDNNLRGGLSCPFQPYFKANAPELPDYDPDKPTTMGTYLDATSLYPFCMSKPIPTQPPQPCDVDLETALRWTEDDEIGYYLEVDFEIPAARHDDVDFAPICHKELDVKKLVPTLEPQKGYALHVALLQQYALMGAEITVRRAWSFPQARILKPFFDKVSRLRAESKDPLFKQVLKLLQNTPYGKLLENVRKRLNLSVFSSPEKWEKAAGSERAYDFRILRLENGFLGTVQLQKPKGVVVDTPRLIGNIVLDYAKAHMYWFYYQRLKPQFGPRLRLLYTDTDSVILALQSDDHVEELKKVPFMDLSILGDKTNNGVLGTFKFECVAKDENGKKILKDGEEIYSPIVEYAGPAAKVYSYETLYSIVNKTKGDRKNKGVPEHKVKQMAHEAFVRQVHDPQEETVEYNSIRSFANLPHHVRQSKRALPLGNDKVHHITTTESRPLGHWRNK